MDKSLPRHIAIIMDGNGRWAKQHQLPRLRGHEAGVDALRAVITSVRELGIPYLTVFAFSTENWKRPQEEVTQLLNLFLQSLEAQAQSLKEQDIKLKILGQSLQQDSTLATTIQKVESLTAKNSTCQLNIAFDYGGRSDIVNACRSLALAVQDGEISADEITEAYFANALQSSGLPSPDLFIRTGGEQRLSNFMLWDLSYTELYFTDTYWPDFREAALEKAIGWYQTRQRRFGGLDA